MLVAARLGGERFGADLIETHEALLRAAGLPVKVPAADIEPVLTAISGEIVLDRRPTG